MATWTSGSRHTHTEWPLEGGFASSPARPGCGRRRERGWTPGLAATSETAALTSPALVSVRRGVGRTQRRVGSPSTKCTTCPPGFIQVKRLSRESAAAVPFSCILAWKRQGDSQSRPWVPRQRTPGPGPVAGASPTPRVSRTGGIEKPSCRVFSPPQLGKAGKRMNLEWCWLT